MTNTDVTIDEIAMLDAKLDRLTEQVGVLTADAEQRAHHRAMLSELTGDVVAISPEAMARLVDVLGEAERRGYFTFVNAAAGVADRVVTNFDEHDVDRLGDNIVGILQTVRDITQPEMLTLLGRAVAAVRAEQGALTAEPDEAPSLWTLIRQLREPAVRRGIGRALHTLGAVTTETGATRTGSTGRPPSNPLPGGTP